MADPANPFRRSSADGAPPIAPRPLSMQPTATVVAAAAAAAAASRPASVPPEVAPPTPQSNISAAAVNKTGGQRMSRKQSAKERVRSAKLGVRVWCLRNWFGLALFFVAVLGLAIALALFIRPFKSTRIVNTTTVVNTTRSVQAAADVIFLIDGSGRWVGA